MTDKKKVFVAFTGDEMLQEFGRLSHPLLRAFLAAGYEVLVYDNLRQRLAESHSCEEKDLPEPARLVLSMPGIRFTAALPPDPANCEYLFDYPLAAARRCRWKRRLRVRFDLFSAHRLHDPVIVPYGMFPSHSEAAAPEHLDRLRRMTRRMRLFFAGDSKGYVRKWIHYPVPKLPRHEVLTALRQDAAQDLIEVHGLEEIERLCEAGFVDRLVLCDSGSGVPQPHWLSTVARADFFLCPPGIVMPMCHNAIEAMAVGTIPLIGYPEWFHPNLEDGKNCLAFDDRASLVGQVRRALQLPADDVARLRANVIRYYEDHLRPDHLIELIDAHPEPDVDLLIHTELNTAKHFKKLGRHSIIIKGSGINGPLRRLGRAWSSLTAMNAR
jgi:hypothetical protein